MKLKTLALAAALVASAPSFAAIQPGNDAVGSSELWLTVFDDTAKISYTLDLGVLQPTFRTAADGAVAGYTRSWAMDTTYFASFVSQTSVSNWRWLVNGYDNVGPNTVNGKSVTTTVTNGVTFPAALNNGQLTTALVSYDQFLSTTNQLGSHAPELNNAAVNGASVSTAPSNYALGQNFSGNNGGTLYPFTTDNAVGDSSAFAYITRSSTSQIAPVVASLFGNAAGTGAFTFAATGAGTYALSYTLAPVPEPESYALMLAGLGCIGLLASRRKAG